MKKFLPFIIDDKGRSIVEDGKNIITSSIPNALNESPDGWEKNSIQFTRTKDFWGMVRSFTTPLKFRLSGARSLRHFFYRFGMETVLFFVWLKLDDSFGGGMKYKSWYKGQFDFYEFNDTYDGVEIKVSEGGLVKDIQDNKTLPYEFILDSQKETVSVLMDGMDIEQFANYVILNSAFVLNNKQHTINTSLISTENIAQINAVSQDRVRFANNTELFATQPFLKTNTDVPVSIKIKWGFGVLVQSTQGQPIPPNLFGFIVVRAFNQSGTAVQTWVLQTYGTAGNFYNRHYNLSGELLITAPADTNLYFFNAVTQDGIGQAIGSAADGITKWTYDEAETDLFTASYTYRHPKSICQGLRAFDLGNLLIDKVGNSTLESDLLSNDNSLIITSGDALRRFDGAKIKTKFSDYFIAIDAVKCASFGIDGESGRLEKRDFAYNPIIEMADLGLSDEMEISPADDYIYDTIENGYPAKDIGDVNGKYSFCNTNIYNTPASPAKKNPYKQISPYLADPFVIEIYRINLDGKKTTDNEKDNDVFFLDCVKLIPDYSGAYSIYQSATAGIWTIKINENGYNLQNGVRFYLPGGLNLGYYTVYDVDDNGTETFISVAQNLITEDTNGEVLFRHYELKRFLYSEILGVPANNNVFNLELSPKSILKNHYGWLSGAMDKLEAKKITFQTTDKNDKLSKTLFGVTTVEKADIEIATLGPKTFKPYYLTFKAESPQDIIEVFSNGLGVFSIDGLKGFPIDIKSDATDLQTQTYKLLTTPDTDLLNYIDR